MDKTSFETRWLHIWLIQAYIRYFSTDRECDVIFFFFLKVMVLLTKIMHFFQSVQGRFFFQSKHQLWFWSLIICISQENNMSSIYSCWAQITWKLICTLNVVGNSSRFPLWKLLWHPISQIIKDWSLYQWKVFKQY